MGPPSKPDPSDCCNSGCNPCILDVYEEQLAKYNSSLSESSVNTDNCISQTSYTRFCLVRSVQHTANVVLFTFRYCGPGPVDRLGLIYKPGQHFLIKGYSAYDKSNNFTRAYTPIPIGKNMSTLEFTVLIKLYHDGRMSQFLKSLREGNETLWRGPYGNFNLEPSLSRILMIAQGTGIAPLYALVRQILNEDLEIFVKLFACYRTKNDILLREELYEYKRFWNFSYDVFLSSGECECKYGETVHYFRLNLSHIRDYVGLHNTNDNFKVLVCGSDNFMGEIKAILKECFVKDDQVVTF